MNKRVTKGVVSGPHDFTIQQHDFYFQPGWSLDTQNKIIIPAQVEVKETETIPSEQQLQLLTDFVAFLEK